MSISFSIPYIEFLEKKVSLLIELLVGIVLFFPETLYNVSNFNDVYFVLYFVIKSIQPRT